MKSLSPLELKDFDASLKGGRKTKRRGNASLRAWVTFVKKVAKEEKLSYKDAMMRAKARKDKGEKWMKGGNMEMEMEMEMEKPEMDMEMDMEKPVEENMPLVKEEMDMDVAMEKPEMGGRRHRRKGKSHKKHGGAKKRGTKKRR
jgi:hypothetical protein